MVADAKTSCEQLLVAIVQDKRVADEQEKQVRLRSCSCTAAQITTTSPANAWALDYCLASQGMA